MGAESISFIGFKMTSDTKAFERKLRKVEGGVALAAAEMLNTVGGMAHAQSIKNLRKTFKLRNQYTENSMKAWPVNYKRSNGQYRDVKQMKFISATWSGYLPLHDEGGVQKARPGSKSIPMPTSRGRPNPNKPIPKGLRLGPRGSAQGSDFGPKSANPQKLFKLPSGIYYRTGRASSASHRAKQRRYDRLFKALGPVKKTTPRPLVMVRSLGVSSQVIKATHWHTGAMLEIGTQENMARAYIQAANRIIAGDKTAF